MREAGPSRARFASPQPTPLELKIPVQFLCSPWGGRRHRKSQASTTADLQRQVPKWDILSETDYTCSNQLGARVAWTFVGAPASSGIFAGRLYCEGHHHKLLPAAQRSCRPEGRCFEVKRAGGCGTSAPASTYFWGGAGGWMREERTCFHHVLNGLAGARGTSAPAPIMF